MVLCRRGLKRLLSDSQGCGSAALQAAGPAARAAAVQHGALAGFHDAFAASALIALVSIGFALLIPDEDAAATMRPRDVVAAEVEPAA
ncbi:MAG TPA: hypothetical protein VK821_04980 [Dehalococcoidia bacterium]|nr:hypothetical protein [Dehalococcoidia bacterium]